MVISGELEVLRPSGVDETLVTVHAPGQLTGEVSTLSGRRALFRLRAATAGEVIELDPALCPRVIAYTASTIAVFTGVLTPKNTGAPSLRGLQGRSATGLNGQAAKEEVSALWRGGAGCRKIFLAFRQGEVFFT